MPIFTTFLIGRPVCPRQLPSRTLLREAGHPAEYRVHFRDDVLACHEDRGVTGGAQRDVEGGAGLGGVDDIAPEHRLDALPQAAGFGEGDEETERFVRDPVLGVVEVDAPSLNRQPCASSRVGGEEVA